MKSLVIGGSNGIGLAISKQLIEKGYHVIIMDKLYPCDGILPSGAYEYVYLDMLDLDEERLIRFALDKELSVLIITAGFGRIADFEFFHTLEIKNMMMVNATATIQILRLFYDRIKGIEPFFCGVMGSISGFVSSPLAAVYAASKAAVCRFIESVDIELEVEGTKNRILNVSPGTFKGSHFYGGETQINLLEQLATSILNHLFNRDMLYIPQYDETYKAIIESYNEDPHLYGLHSYEFKRKSGRIENIKRIKIGYMSGTFDLFHVGHLNIIRRAKQQCDYLIVGVHKSGAWKGKDTFIPFDERMAIVGSCKYVDKVVESCKEDSDAWNKWHFDLLFVGSDYKGSERFNMYEEFFKGKDVEIVYFPYTKSTSSTQIRNALTIKTNDEEMA